MISKPKQSKETEIRRKLAQSGITKAQEYEEIISNLINQRQRLYTDLNILREKVLTLQQKEAQRQATRNLRKRSSVSKNQTNYREELNKKYEELKHWQKLSMKAMKNTRLQIQYKAFLDKVSWLEQEIQTAMKQLNDEYVINKRLNKAMKSYTKEQKKSNNVQETIEQQNQNLKKRIFSMKMIVNQQANKQIYLHDYLIEIKEKDRFQQRQIESRLRKSSIDIRKSSIGRVKTEAARSSYAELDVSFADQIIEFQLLPQQITSKEDSSQMQDRLNRMQDRWNSSIYETEDIIQRSNARQILDLKRQGSKLTYRKEFEIVIEQLKSMVEQMVGLNRKKIGLYLEMNSINEYQVSKRKLTQRPKHKKQLTDELGQNVKQLQAHLKQIRGKSSTIENQPNSAINRPQSCLEATFSQTLCTQYFDFDSFRKDFVGQLGKKTYFHRSLLENERHTSIKTLEIYYSDRGIATVKAYYNIHSDNTIKESTIALPDQFIKNYCKVHVVDTNSDDFVRYFKVKHNILENRVTQIKIVTNKNIKNGWGDAKIKGEGSNDGEQAQKQMVLDINQDQYPVSIFCSHIQKGPYWYLCGFGVQINDL